MCLTYIGIPVLTTLRMTSFSVINNVQSIGGVGDITVIVVSYRKKKKVQKLRNRSYLLQCSVFTLRIKKEK